MGAYTSAFLALALLAIRTSGQSIIPNITGNCVSGTYSTSNPSSWFLQDQSISTIPANLDPAKHSFVAQSNARNIRFATNDDRAHFDMHAPPNNGAIRASWSRYMLRGKVSLQIAASNALGMSTGFITFSDSEDEIDFEMIGSEPTSVYTNIFYKGLPEFWRMSKAEIGHIDQMHTLTIDWTKTSIKWIVNGVTIRTVTAGSEDLESRMLPNGEHWFPNTPSLPMFSLWQGAWAGTAGWTPDIAHTASFGDLTVQCYDDNDQPVPEWPVGSSSYVYPPAAGIEAVTPSKRSSEASIPGCTEYTVVNEGETCQSLAKAQGKALPELLAMNPQLKYDCRVLEPGSRICVKRSVFNQPAKEEEKVAMKKTCSMDTAAEGDTCESIALRNRVSARQLSEWNAVECKSSTVGSPLIPGTILCVSEPVVKRRRRAADEL
ncbi:hypothetical protein HDU89_006791 [Geranomyces variabilis]|nr:hypothetical protein HDU89_006791 [Geranomyces variabilis]